MDRDKSLYVEARVLRPLKGDQPGYYECAWEIARPDGVKRRFAAGVDAFQSLQLALQMVGAELDTLETQSGYSLSVE